MIDIVDRAMSKLQIGHQNVTLCITAFLALLGPITQQQNGLGICVQALYSKATQ